VLDEELLRLPPKYRAPLVLHYLEGKTKEQTARELGWTEGTVSGRLARARQLLRTRLTRRGVALAGGAAAAELSQGAAAGLPAVLAHATRRAAVGWLTGGAAAAVLPVRVAGLVEEALRGLLVGKLQIGAALLLALALLAAAGLAARRLAADKPASPVAGPPEARHAPGAGRPRFVRQVPARDPLPPGALVRLGTNRGRHGRDLTSLAFSPDGKLLATRARDDMIRVWEPASGREVAVLRGHPAVPWSGFWCFAFAPHGNALVTGGGDGVVRFWDPVTGKHLHPLRAGPSDVRALAFAADGRLLATGDLDGRIQVWDAATHARVHSFRPGAGSVSLLLQALAFSPDNRTLATIRAGFPEGSVIPLIALELWDSATGARVGRLRGRDSYLPGLVFSPDGRRFAWAEERDFVCVRETATLRVVRRLPGNRDGWRGFAFVAGGRQLAVASRGSVGLWDVDAGRRVRGLACPGRTLCLALTRDGKTLAAGTAEGTFHLWDVGSGKAFPRPAGGHRGPVQCVAYSPDGRTLATSSQDGTIRLWRAASGKELRRWPAHAPRGGAPSPWGLAFSRDGKALASGGPDGTLRIWDVATGRELRRFRERGGSRGGHVCLEFSLQGGLLATRDVRGGVRLWSAAGEEVRRLQAGNPQDTCRWMTRLLAFSPDEKYLASAQGLVVRVWETATGRALRPLATSGGDVTAVAFSPDGTRVASGNLDGSLHLWDLAAGRECRRAVPAPAVGGSLDALNLLGRMPASWYCEFTGLVFARDGQRVIGGRADGAVYVWDLAAGRLTCTPARHREGITCLALSPDGAKLATSSADATVLVWDVTALAR
jgi:WD40 repeat protein